MFGQAMALSNPFYELSINPVIEYVDVVRKNPRDHSKIIFKVKGDPKTVIQWCRRNFGDRGDGWDFSGGTKSLEVTIWSSRLITMWEMWQN
jgi:hypothetical protein